MSLVEIQNDVFRIQIDTDQGTGIAAFFVKKENAWLPIMPDSRNEDIDLKFASFLMVPYSNRIENGSFTDKIRSAGLVDLTSSIRSTVFGAGPGDVDLTSVFTTYGLGIG